MHEYSFLELFLNTGGAWEHVVAAGQAGTYWYVDLIRDVLRALIGLFAVLLVVPPLVWYERRLLGWMQQRQGQHHYMTLMTRCPKRNISAIRVSPAMNSGPVNRTRKSR